MQVDYSVAKDNSRTFSINGVFFHSTYSPQKEAQRFVDSLECIIKPEIVFLIEPGLDYLSGYLKQKFNCITVCIRIIDEQLDDKSGWDYVIPYNRNLSQTLLNLFGEEKLLSSTIFVWKPAENLFREQVLQIIAEYKNTLEKCKTLIVTRQFFEKKWLINSCNFVSFAKNFVDSPIKSGLPVVVCASGPSLKPGLKILKEKRNSVFIICLSSSTSVLLKNQIIPDLVLSTDGGYWAGQHLKQLYSYPDIPVAVSSESFIPKKILKTNPIAVLKYNDDASFISSGIIEKCKCKTFVVERNATVSGTALSLAKTISDNSIYFMGLDLSSGKGHAHTQPNELEKNNSLNDCRTKNLTTRILASQFNSQSLEIYRDWFASQENVGNVFRVIENPANKLGKISDISTVQFEKQIDEGKTQSFSVQTEDSSIDKKQIFKYIKDELKTEAWQKQIFPADYISIKNSQSDEEKQTALNRLEDKMKKLISKINGLENE